MSNFSDREDRDLVKLVVAYEIRKERIVWSDVVKRMSYARKEARVLQQRLTTLKNTYGKNVQSFPRRFFLPSPRTPRRLNPHRKPALSRIGEKTGTNLNAISQDVVEHWTGATQSPAASSLSSEAASAAVTQIFSSVRRFDVHQPAGRQETNVGELTPAGTTTLIQLIGVEGDDVFVDIGSGIGNVVAQVALESAVRMAIGLEIRPHLVCLSRELVQIARERFPRLACIRMIDGDICSIEPGSSIITEATVIFANNLLFTPSANQALHKLCCQLPYLRMVLLVDHVCPRHKSRCSNVFCAMCVARAERSKLETQFCITPIDVTIDERRVHTAQ